MEATYHQANGRFKFLEAIKTRNPEVLRTLHDQVLPIFRFAMTHRARATFEGEEMDTDASLSSGPSRVLYMKGSTYLEQLANMQTCIEYVVKYLATHENERYNKYNELTVACRISAALQEDIRRSSTEERWAFLEYWRRTILVQRGATEMYIAVGEVDKAPIPVSPYPCVKWSEMESHQKLAKVRAAISEWAERYSLTDPWILETVVQTLLLWMAHPECDERLRLAHAGHLCQIPQDPPRFQVELRPFESWRAFNYRVNEELKAFRSTHIEDFLEVGHDHKHAFEWLALFQTKLYSPRKIAIEFERETGERRAPSAIILAYQAAAEEIGLTLRRTLRGPRTKKRS